MRNGPGHAGSVRDGARTERGVRVSGEVGACADPGSTPERTGASG